MLGSKLIMAAIFMVALVGVACADLTNQVQISGTQTVTGQSMMVSGESMYAEGLFSTGGVFMGATSLGGSGYSANRLLNGTNLHYTEFVGYQGLKTSNSTGSGLTMEGTCAPQNVDYKQIYSGSSFMLDSGQVRTGTQVNEGLIGYGVRAIGEGSGNIWSNGFTAFGQIPGCGEVGPIVQTGGITFGNSYTATGMIDMTSAFKYTWMV